MKDFIFLCGKLSQQNYFFNLLEAKNKQADKLLISTALGINHYKRNDTKNCINHRSYRSGWSLPE